MINESGWSSKELLELDGTEGTGDLSNEEDYSPGSLVIDHVEQGTYDAIVATQPQISKYLARQMVEGFAQALMDSMFLFIPGYR